MKYAQESVEVKNDIEKYPYRLECDDIQGIIRLHKNTSKAKTTRVTTRNILVTAKAKESINKVRSGFYDKKENPDLPFYGSYISRAIDPETYSKWEHLMIERYKEFVKEALPQQLSLFDTDS